MALTTSELNAIRDAIESTLPDTCAIYYVSRVSDGMGGWTETWTARGTAIPCRITPAWIGTTAQLAAEQVREGQLWLLSVPYDETVSVSDKVVAGGKTYQVRQVNVGESEIGCTRAYLELLE